MIDEIMDKPGKRHIIIIILFALLIRIVFLVGYNLSDDLGYAETAGIIISGKEYVSTTTTFYLVSNMRLLMVYPIALSFKIFGVNDYSLVIYPLLCSIGGIFITYKLGEMLFNKETGILASLLLSFYPMDVIYATWAMPDVPIAFFMASATYFFLKAEKLRENEKYSIKGININKRGVLLVVTGLIIGVSYLIRVSGLMILLVIITYILYRTWITKRIKLDYCWILTGILIIIFLEACFYYTQLGSIDGLSLRYKAIEDTFGSTPGYHDQYYFLRGMLNLDYENNFMWENRYDVHYGLYYYLIIPAIIICILTRDKKAFPVIIWLIALFLWSNYGSMSITKYVLIHKLHRHMTIIAIPSMLILSKVIIDRFYNKKSIIPRTIGLLIIIALFTTSIFYISNRYVYLKASVHDFTLMHTILKDLDDKPIYGDPVVRTQLKYKFKYKKNELIRTIENVKECDEIKDAYVIMKGSRGFVDNEFFINSIPECMYEPPSNWDLIEIIKGPKIDFFSSYDPVVYYVR